MLKTCSTGNAATLRLLSAATLMATMMAFILSASAPAQSPYVQTYGAKGQKTNLIKSRSATTGSTKKDDSSSKADGKSSSSGTAKKKKAIFIVKPKQHVSKKSGWQKYSDYIILKPGQQSLPLTLSVENGSSDTQTFRALRATLSGRELFTEKDFKGKKVLSLNVSNALTSGSTQIIFTAYGETGAAFKWQITTAARPMVKKLNPSKAAIGKKVKVLGSNLPLNNKVISVKVDGRFAKVSGANLESFEFTVPKKVRTGKKKQVLISIAGTKQKTLMLDIVGEPEITTMSMVGVSPQSPITITGKNFSKDAKEVKVTFNGVEAQINSCNDTSINVTVPELGDIPCQITVLVKVNDIPCKKPGRILGSMRQIPNTGGIYSPFEVPGHLL